MRESQSVRPVPSHPVPSHPSSHRPCNSFRSILRSSSNLPTLELLSLLRSPVAPFLSPDLRGLRARSAATASCNACDACDVRRAPEPGVDDRNSGVVALHPGLLCKGGGNWEVLDNWKLPISQRCVDLGRFVEMEQLGRFENRLQWLQ